MPTRTTNTYLLCDRILDGQLDQSLKTWRAEGLTLIDIVIRLREHGARVSVETVRRWVKDDGAAA